MKYKEFYDSSDYGQFYYKCLVCGYTSEKYRSSQEALDEILKHIDLAHLDSLETGEE